MPTATAVKDVPPQSTNKPTEYGYFVEDLMQAAVQRKPPEVTHLPHYVLEQTFWLATTDVDSLLSALVNLLDVVNRDAVRQYLVRHVELPQLVEQTAKEIRQAVPNVSLRLELVSDPEDINTETLVLYLRSEGLEPIVFRSLLDWNTKLSESLVSSDAWFIVNLDLRRQG